MKLRLFKMTIDLSFKDVEVGTKVKTREGFVWIKMTNGWKDKRTGLIWTDEEKGTYTHYEAVEKFGSSLPTKQDFETAEKHGIRAIIDMKGKWFWSASVHPDYDNFAYDFNGHSGGTAYYYRANYDGSVRCVAGGR